MWPPFSKRVRIDWLQIEVSSICNAQCRYCPQNAYRSAWKKQTLAPELVEQLLTCLHPGTYIHLQGWGEPFTHPQLAALIASIKEHGFTVGTTTNGTLLTLEHLEMVVDSGLDLLAFSTAGCSNEENDRNRRGTSLQQVTRCIAQLHRIKAAKKSAVPRLHIAQMLLRSSLSRIDSYPAFWKDLGVEQIILSSLSLVTSRKLMEEARLADSLEQWYDLTERLHDMRLESGLADTLHFHLVSPFMFYKRCSEHIGQAAVIASNGAVAPCMMASLPVAGPVLHWAHGREASRQNMNWGNISDRPFNEIWKQRNYRSFRGQEVMQADQCEWCLKRSVEPTQSPDSLDLSSLNDRWQLIREANEEREAIRRMQQKRQGFTCGSKR